MAKKKYTSFDEYLLDCGGKYNLKLSPVEIGFLSMSMYLYIKDESNRDKGMIIAKSIYEKLKKIDEKIQKGNK